MVAKHKLKRLPTELITMLFMPLSLVYSEVVFRIYYLACHCSGFLNFLGRFFGAGLWLTTLFVFSLGCFLTFISTLFGPKTNRVLSLIFLAVPSLLFMVQGVYHYSFNTILRLTLAADQGGQAMTSFFWSVTVPSILKMLWLLIILAVPFILLAVFGRAHRAKRKHGERWHRAFDGPVINYQKAPGRVKVALLAAILIFYMLPWGIIMCTNKTTGLRAQYTSAFEHSVSAEKFGILTTARREIAITIGKALGMEIVAPTILPESESSSEPAHLEPNVMDIDFNSLIENETNSSIVKMHKYFNSRVPTYKNKYTGILKDYNLVMITAEGFSPYAISQELTPTLYKMREEGFRFPNFYTAGYDDTTTGEFVHTTGLIPSNNIANNLKRVKDNYLPFTMGHQFQKEGIRTYAYHPHTYTYYGRNETHPNLGYNVYRGRGGGVVDGNESESYGLSLEHAKWWPESDLEAINSSAPEYIGKGRFHVYYMSVSGHKSYTFSGNMMCYKNREAVRDLPYCDANRAYIAANMELDKAMESLMKQLEETGQLDRTLFCITPDHKPQELSNEQVEEMAGRPLDDEFEVYRSVFLLYCPGYHDAIEVTAPANSVDILPTVSNLLGLDYDSRLLFGRDLLDPHAEQVITLRTRSWISDRGRYNFRKKEFIPNADAGFSDDASMQAYVDRVNNMVSNKFAMSELVITKDYYRYVFDK